MDILEKIDKELNEGKNIDDIDKFLDKVIDGIYTIKNGVVDVKGNVRMGNMGLKEIPIRFGKVSGSFIVFRNKLTSLKGSPKEVGGNFSCETNKLTSLEGSPKEVGGFFTCAFNKITSLEGAPEKIGGDLIIRNNKIAPTYSGKLGGELLY